MSKELDFFICVSRIAIESLEAELLKRAQHIEKLKKEIERRDEEVQTLFERIGVLEALINSVEFAGCCGSHAHAVIVCPWCDTKASVMDDAIEHAADCPAFSGPGAVRR